MEIIIDIYSIILFLPFDLSPTLKRFLSLTFVGGGNQ